MWTTKGISGREFEEGGFFVLILGPGTPKSIRCPQRTDRTVIFQAIEMEGKQNTDGHHFCGSPCWEGRNYRFRLTGKNERIPLGYWRRQFVSLL